MTTWGWVGIGAGAFLALSLVVALVMARILGSIGSGISQLFEDEAWTSAPLTRAIEPPVDDLSSRRTRQRTRGSKTRS
jgi:hypothetical protein